MGEDEDAVLAAIDELVDAGRANVISWMGVMARADAIREARRQGTAYADMQLAEGPTIIGAVSANQERLTAAGVRLRRALVVQLYGDGVGQAEIARLFGVSRQRIANLLKDLAASDPPQ